MFLFLMNAIPLHDEAQGRYLETGLTFIYSSPLNADQEYYSVLHPLSMLSLYHH